MNQAKEVKGVTKSVVTLAKNANRILFIRNLPFGIDGEELDVERRRIDLGHERRRDDVEEHFIPEERVEIVHVLDDHARDLRSNGFGTRLPREIPRPSRSARAADTFARYRAAAQCLRCRSWPR